MGDHTHRQFIFVAPNVCALSLLHDLLYVQQCWKSLAASINSGTAKGKININLLRFLTTFLTLDSTVLTLDNTENQLYNILSSVCHLKCKQDNVPITDMPIYTNRYSSKMMKQREFTFYPSVRGLSRDKPSSAHASFVNTSHISAHCIGSSKQEYGEFSKPVFTYSRLPINCWISMGKNTV